MSTVDRQGNELIYKSRQLARCRTAIRVICSTSQIHDSLADRQLLLLVLTDILYFRHGTTDHASIAINYNQKLLTT